MDGQEDTPEEEGRKLEETGASYFLLRRLRKVAGEFALFCLGYNLERAKYLLGFKKMMELMEQA